MTLAARPRGSAPKVPRGSRQSFSTALQGLVHLALQDASSAEHRLTSDRLAACAGAHPVAMRRVIATLVKSGLLCARQGAGGGVWLAAPAAKIDLAAILDATGQSLRLGQAPVGQADTPGPANLSDAIKGALGAAETAARKRLATITLAQMAELAGSSATP